MTKLGNYIWLFVLVLIGALSVAVLVEGDISITHLSDFISGDLTTGYEYIVLYSIRLPKVVVITMVGASLAVAGYILQQLVNNPLADPYLLSTASGAALGVNLTIAGVLPAFTSFLYVMPFYGFVFGFASTVLAVLISTKQKQVNTLLLVIAGVSLSSLLTAITSLLVFYSDSTSKLRSMLFWAMGSFEKTQWEQVPLIVVVLSSSIVMLYFFRKHLFMLMMGSVKAQLLGASVRRIQFIMLFFSTLLVSVCVSICGPIGFVGLIIPHFSRSFIGTTHQHIVLFNAFLGAVFLLSCELIAQLVVTGIGLPVGIVASFVGLPFFLYLLFNKKYRFGQ